MLTLYHRVFTFMTNCFSTLNPTVYKSYLKFYPKGGLTNRSTINIEQFRYRMKFALFNALTNQIVSNISLARTNNKLKEQKPVELSFYF